MEDEVQVHTFERDEDTGRGHRLIDHWVPESKARQCQEGVDHPQTVQLHGGPTSSTTQGVFFFLILINSLQGQKEKISSESSWNSMAQIKPAPYKYGFMMSLNSHQQKLMSLRFWWCRSGDYIQILWSFTKLISADEAGPGSMCADFHLVKMMFVFSKSVPLWQTDEKIRLTPEGGKHFF